MASVLIILEGKSETPLPPDGQSLRSVRCIDAAMWRARHEHYDAIVWVLPRGSYLPIIEDLRALQKAAAVAVLVEDLDGDEAETALAVGVALYLRCRGRLTPTALGWVIERACALSRAPSEGPAPLPLAG